MRRQIVSAMYNSAVYDAEDDNLVIAISSPVSFLIQYILVARSTAALMFTWRK